MSIEIRGIHEVGVDICQVFTVPIEDAELNLEDQSDWMIRKVPSMKVDIPFPKRQLSKNVHIDKLQLLVNNMVICEWEK